MSFKTQHFPFQFIFLMILLLPVLRETRSPARANAEPSCELVVLVDPDDPYYLLAREIAVSEQASLASTLGQAIACQPTYLLWVASPGFLSDAAMVAFGKEIKARSSAISTGIITASTMEKARELWQRRNQVQGEKLLAVNAPNPSAHIDQGQLLAVSQKGSDLQPLTKTDFIHALRSTDYLTFTGHGSSRYLRLDENTLITAGDVPSLEPLVINTGSCQTLRPWAAESIALQFIDQGVAAYSGFVFSPNEGYLLGEFDGFPMRYTWKDYPIGHVILVQNRGTLQGFAQFPYLFLLGDPRIALQSEAPYRQPDDYQEGEQRILKYHNLPSGVIPIRIQGGAVFHFVEALGLTSATDQDLFYNSRMQMVNIGSNKFVLLVQGGGDLTLRLSPKAPWFWFLRDFLLDSLDHTLIFSQQSSGDLVALAFSIFPLAWVLWQGLRRRLSWRNLFMAMSVGFGAATLQGLYALVRLDRVTITTKTVVFSPLSMLAAFILTTCGALIFFQARSWIGRVIALLVSTFATWAVALVMMLVLSALNYFGFVPRIGVPLYNYSLSLLSIGTILVTLPLTGLVFGFANWRVKRSVNQPKT